MASAKQVLPEKYKSNKVEFRFVAVNLGHSDPEVYMAPLREGTGGEGMGGGRREVGGGLVDLGDSQYCISLSPLHQKLQKISPSNSSLITPDTFSLGFSIILHWLPSWPTCIVILPLPYKSPTTSPVVSFSPNYPEPSVSLLLPAASWLHQWHPCTPPQRHFSQISPYPLPLN